MWQKIGASIVAISMLIMSMPGSVQAEGESVVPVEQNKALIPQAMSLEQALQPDPAAQEIAQQQAVQGAVAAASKNSPPALVDLIDQYEKFAGVIAKYKDKLEGQFYEDMWYRFLDLNEELFSWRYRITLEEAKKIQALHDTIYDSLSGGRGDYPPSSPSTT